MCCINSPLWFWTLAIPKGCLMFTTWKSFSLSCSVSFYFSELLLLTSYLFFHPTIFMNNNSHAVFYSAHIIMIVQQCSQHRWIYHFFFFFNTSLLISMLMATYFWANLEDWLFYAEVPCPHMNYTTKKCWWNSLS